MTQTYADRIAPVIDNDEYPGRWLDLIGQTHPKRKLHNAAKSARLRGTRMEHTLIVGPPGVGKTALGVLVSRELRTPVRVISGPLESTTARLLFMGMKDRDVVFVDEAHSTLAAGRIKSEWWLNFLQDGVIPGPLGMEKMPDVLIIAATSEPQRLSKAVRDRFPIDVQLLGYSVEEAAKIVTVTTKRVLGKEGLPTVTGADAVSVARASLRNPRIIHKFATTLRDVTVTDDIKMLTTKRYDIPALLAYLEVTEDGLTRDHREYLRVLCEEFGGKAGYTSLVGRILASESLEVVEKPLLDAGLIAKTSSGRIITGAGIQRHNALAAEVVAA